MDIKNLPESVLEASAHLDIYVRPKKKKKEPVVLPDFDSGHFGCNCDSGPLSPNISFATVLFYNYDLSASVMGDDFAENTDGFLCGAVTARGYLYDVLSSPSQFARVSPPTSWPRYEAQAISHIHLQSHLIRGVETEERHTMSMSLQNLGNVLPGWYLDHEDSIADEALPPVQVITYPFNVAGIYVPPSPDSGLFAFADSLDAANMLRVHPQRIQAAVKWGETNPYRKFNFGHSSYKKNNAFVRVQPKKEPGPDSLKQVITQHAQAYSTLLETL